MEIKKVTQNNGEYLCDIDISTDEWKTILQDENLLNDNYKDALIKFHSEPNHKSTCKALGDKYNVSPQSFNGTITNFAKAVQKKLNRFEIIGTDGKPSYWIIPMLGKHVGEFFEWTLRPELVQAMEELNLKGKHLLQKIYDEAIENKHWVFFDWFPAYKKSVQEYKEQAINNNWTDTVFQKLVKDTTKNGISDLQQGNFTWEEFEKIKNNWSEIQPIIKSIAEENQISKAQYKEILVFFGKQTSGNRPSGTNRVVAAFLPNIVTTVVNYRYLRDVIAKLKNRFPDYPIIQEEWLTDNFNFIYYCNSNVVFNDSWHSSVFAWYLKEYFEVESQLIQKNEVTMQKYIDLLLYNKNLILTGAPGTGKTYLAKEIAKALNAEIEFVQFHPSYDYTDFVEGLRPLKKEGSELGFELKDGVFKSFCKKAAENIEDSKKSIEELQKQKSISDNLSLFIEKIENEISTNGQFKLYGIGGKECASIIEIDANSFTTKSISGNTLNTPLSSILTKYDKYTQNKDVIWTFKEVGEKLSVTYHHTYFFAFLKAFDAFLQENKSSTSEVEIVERKEFVIIIDEINRAEISKVFGELFFSIDAGYRGIEGRVKTQYSNLQEDGDIFKDGFYIPENVYIIGTMNDIDRSVESFDFAMRRRFAWKEIKAIDRISMWDGIIDDWKEEALKRMTSLNTKIESIEGLGSAFHIGPAYFLKLKNYKGSFDQLWNNHLEGLLFEYLRGFPDSNLRLNELKTAYEVSIESQSNVEND